MASNAKAVFDFLKLVTPMPSSAYNSFESTAEILTRLKFIGTIEAGEKLDVRNLKIESNTIITPIKRMFFGEGRDATYAFTYTTIERSFAILYSLAATDKVSDSLLCANILHDMNKAINGLNNMQTTYKDDKMFVCNIETLIQTIQAKMLEVQQKYPDIWSLVKQPTPQQSPLVQTMTAVLPSIPPLTEVAPEVEPSATSATSSTQPQGKKK